MLYRSTYCKYPLSLFCISTLLHIIYLIFLYMPHNKCMMLNSNFVSVWPIISQFHIFFISFSVLHWSGQNIDFLLYQQRFCPVTDAMKSDENLGNTREILFNVIITVADFFNFVSQKKKKKAKATKLLWDYLKSHKATAGSITKFFRWRKWDANCWPRVTFQLGQKQE